MNQDNKESKRVEAAEAVKIPSPDVVKAAEDVVAAKELNSRQYFRVPNEVTESAYLRNAKAEGPGKKGGYKYGITDAYVYSALLRKYIFYFTEEKLEDGWFYQSLRQLAAATGLSVKRVLAAVQLLARDKWIEMKKGDAKKGEANFYKLIDIELEPRYVHEYGKPCKNKGAKSCNHCSRFIYCQKKGYLTPQFGKQIVAPIRNNYVVIFTRLVKLLGMNAAAVYGVLAGQMKANRKKGLENVHKSIRKIADLIYLQPETVISNLRRLESCGLLVKVKGKIGHHNIYKVLPAHKVVPVAVSCNSAPMRKQLVTNAETGTAGTGAPMWKQGVPMQQHIINTIYKHKDKVQINTEIKRYKCDRGDLVANVFLCKTERTQGTILQKDGCHVVPFREDDVESWTFAAGFGDGVVFAATQDILEQYKPELQFLP